MDIVYRNTQIELLDFKRYIKRGAPIIEVTTPTGSSPEGKDLAMVSQEIINIPPIGRDRPITRLCSDPTNILVKWGIIKPTKPIIPEKDTIIPVTVEARRSRITRYLFISKPRA